MHPFPFAPRYLLPLLVWTPAGALLGCAAAPTGPPEQIAPRIVALLDDGKVAEADALFAGAARGDGREALYPLLYETAHGRYERGEAAPAAGVLRFMARQYPKSSAVREARVYALFLRRAELDKPAPELLEETDTALAAVRAGRPEVPPWIELVEAQNAIDQGELKSAREAFARFRQAHKEPPAELADYVQDIDRYLSSHAGGTTP